MLHKNYKAKSLNLEDKGFQAAYNSGAGVRGGSAVTTNKACIALLMRILTPLSSSFCNI